MFFSSTFLSNISRFLLSFGEHEHHELCPLSDLRAQPGGSGVAHRPAPAAAPKGALLGLSIPSCSQKSSHGQTTWPIALRDARVNDEVQQESLCVSSRWVFSCLFDTCLIGAKAKSQILDKTALSRLRRGCQERELVPTAAKSTCSLSHPGPVPPWANLSLFQLFPFSVAGIWQNLSSPG